MPTCAYKFLKAAQKQNLDSNVFLLSSFEHSPSQSNSNRPNDLESKAFNLQSFIGEGSGHRRTNTPTPRSSPTPPSSSSVAPKAIPRPDRSGVLAPSSNNLSWLQFFLWNQPYEIIRFQINVVSWSSWILGKQTRLHNLRREWRSSSQVCCVRVFWG